MTHGEKRVGMSFNPSNLPAVTQVKGIVANLIDNMDQLASVDSEVRRLSAIAQTKFEEACMFAVKAIVADNQERHPSIPLG